MTARALIAITTALIGAPLWAQDDAQIAFVEANILGIFYHELGHALIDFEGVPVFGQEEDAADVFSIYMIHAIFEPDAAEALAYDIALGFAAEADANADDGIAWWDVHGPDEQRFYNTVCLFYGGDPDSRDDYADDLGLPEDRADSCPEEFDLADASWGQVLDDISGAGETIIFLGGPDLLATDIIAEEVAALNAELTLSQPLRVEVDACDEANAWYDPGTRTITFCSEFEDYLFELAEDLG